MRKRDLFTFAGEVILSKRLKDHLFSKGSNPIEQLRQELNELKGIDQEQFSDVQDQDIFCQIVKISYGKGNKNPISHLTAFYQPITGKENEWQVGELPQGFNKLVPYFLHRVPNSSKLSHHNISLDSVSRLAPKEFEEVYIRVYSRYPSQSTKLKNLFDKVIIIFLTEYLIWVTVNGLAIEGMGCLIASIEKFFTNQNLYS